MKYIVTFLITGFLLNSSYSQQGVNNYSHYLFPDFTKGFILMKNGQKSNYMLNYNSITNEMVFNKNKVNLAVTDEEMKLIDTVYIKDRKFIVLNNQFVEFAYKSKFGLYVEHKCKIQDKGAKIGYGRTSPATSQLSISALSDLNIYYGGTGLLYKFDLPERYVSKSSKTYWLEIDNQIEKFTNLGKLKKIFSNKKSLIKKYLKTNSVTFNNQKSVASLVSSLE